MAVLIETGIQLGDLIIAEDAGPIVTRESRNCTNEGEDDVTLEIGAPFDITSDTEAEYLAAAGIANCNALLIARTLIPAGKTVKVPLLARGPAAVNQDKLPATDYAGATINAANFATAVAAFPLVVLRREPPTQSEQTT